MESIKTINEINEVYNGKWVYMIDCETNDSGTLTKGRVVLSSESRDNVLRRMSEFDGDRSLASFRYAGKIPEGVHYLLFSQKRLILKNQSKDSN